MEAKLPTHPPRLINRRFSRNISTKLKGYFFLAINMHRTKSAMVGIAYKETTNNLSNIF